MKRSLRLSLKAGEEIFINGAHLRVDRRVSLFLLNEAEFLLSQHVLAPEQGTTPMTQLHLAIQSLMMAPQDKSESKTAYHRAAQAAAQDEGGGLSRHCLMRVDELVQRGKLYEALRILREHTRSDSEKGIAPRPDGKVGECGGAP